MKRKLFTLLLAIGVLTTFQANAQTAKSPVTARIFVDHSGLDKNKSEKDSFPKEKKNIFNWFSFNGENIYVKTDAAATDSAKSRARALADPGSVFRLNWLTLGEVGGQTIDTLRFSITPKGSNKPLELPTRDGIKTNRFSILTGTPDSIDADGKDHLYVNLFDSLKFAGFGHKPDGTLVDSLVQGYLVWSLAGAGDVKLELNTPENLAFVVENQTTKELGLKYFNEFAFYGTNLPVIENDFLKFQYGYALQTGTREFHTGRLYQTQEYPFFAIYDRDKDLLGNSNKPYNWRKDNENPLDTAAYTYLNAKVIDNKALQLDGRTIDLDSIIWFIGDWKNKVYATGNNAQDSAGYYSYLLDSIFKPTGKDTVVASPWVVPGSQLSDSAHWAWRGFDRLPADFNLSSVKTFHKDSADAVWIYLKNNAGNLEFTVKTGAENTAASWSNGYPTKFASEEIGDPVYYRVDTMVWTVLADVVNYFSIHNGNIADKYATVRNDSTRIDSLFTFSYNKDGAVEAITGKRYLYKQDKNNDFWYPLFVKVEETDDSEPERLYTYVDGQWLKDYKFHLGSVEQKIIIKGFEGRSIIEGDKSYATLSDVIPGVELMFEIVDSLDEKGLLKYYKKLDINGDEEVQPKFATWENIDTLNNNKDSIIAVFRIKQGDKYLTVLDTIAFKSPLTNTLGWVHQDSTFEDENGIANDRILQYFAILRDYTTDSIVTFLPLARKDFGAGDTLIFNLKIGQIRNDFANLDNVFRVEAALTHELVVADILSEMEPLSVALYSTLTPWKWNANIDKYVSIQSTKTGFYYHGNGDTTSVYSKNDIGSHWKVEKTFDKEGKIDDKWRFTPTYTDYGKAGVVRRPTFSSEGKIKGNSKGIEVFAYQNPRGEVIFAHATDTLNSAPVIGDTLVKITSVVEDVTNFDLYATTPSKRVNIWSKYDVVKYISFDRDLGVTDSILEVGYDQFASEPPVVNVVKIADTVLVSNSKERLYEYPAYKLFFVSANRQDTFFLGLLGDERVIKWIHDSIANKEDSYTKTEFRLLNYVDATDGKDYQFLQIHNGKEQLIMAGGDGSNYSLSDTSGLYRIVQNVKGLVDERVAIKWTLSRANLSTDYLKIDGINERVAGIFHSTDFTDLVITQSAAGLGRLGTKVDDKANLLFEKVENDTAIVEPVEPVLAQVEDPVYYYISLGGKYLIDNGEVEDASFFGDKESATHFALALADSTEAEGYKIMLETKAANYLTIMGKYHLLFNPEKDDAYEFTLEFIGEPEILKDLVYIKNIQANGAEGKLHSAEIAGQSLAIGEEGVATLVDTESADNLIFTIASAALPLVAGDPDVSTTDDTIHYYIGTVDGKYLTIDEEDKVVFAEVEKEDATTFAFDRVEDNDQSKDFVIFSAAGYLTLGDEGFAFGDSKEAAHTFGLPLLVHYYPTGIKTVNASAVNVYGVIGGVKVVNATGAVAIYTIDGRLVAQKAVVAPAQTISVPAGIYIVRNGSEVSKVLVK
ncbi:MAG: T9SS type A sorting domain-containing protein [Dysgonamonadaceae bacterium]|jgi:hypothetical protein|nr:T9SS type A sorting domain-containing protein [Dysgonamonadaceae bacterium]